MKLNHLHVSGFLGIEVADVDLAAPVNVFAGPNGAGKTSLRDAFVMALDGSLARIDKKKDAAELIRRGAKAAKAEISTAEGDRFGFSITASGAMKETRTSKLAADWMPYVLGAQRLAAMPPKERAAFLFGLTGVKLDPKVIGERMLARECSKVHVDRIVPVLRAGTEAAHTEAKAQATAARADWKAVTGENYGSEKAQTWAATPPAYDAAAHQAAQHALRDRDARLAEANQRLGAMRADARRRDELVAKLPGLQERAALAQRRAEKLAIDELELARLDGEIEKAAAAAGTGPRVGLVHDLATGVAYLLSFADDSVASADAQAALDAYEREHGKIGAATGVGDAADLAATLERLRKARQTCANAIAADKRDIADSQAAEVAAKDAQQQIDALKVDAAAIAAEQAACDHVRAERVSLAAKVEAARTAAAAVEQAQKTTAKAGEHHEAVAGWERVVAALAPDGIPGEMLAEALGPINARLAQSSVDAGWPPVTIGPDMTITSGQTLYHLLSRSEQWRCDAMLAEAVSFISGVRLLVLDEFDLLQPSARPELLGWLDALAVTGEIDSAVIFGTLEAAPTGLCDTTAAWWVQGGFVMDMPSKTGA